MLEENPLAKYFPKPQVTYPDVGAENDKFLKKVYVQTWGCQMNVSDTERMLALLAQRNYRTTDTPDDADLVLLNTCHIREKARHKLVSRLGELRPLKERKPDSIFAVAGCVAQAEAKILAKDVPFIDIIFGPDQIEEFPELLEKAVMKSEKYSDDRSEGFHGHTDVMVETGFNKDPYSIPVDIVPPYIDGKNLVSRYINIIKGCNNFCTFCVVPYTRGREKSRLQSEVIDESKFFINTGVKEVVLLGQNVNSYGLDLLEDDKDGKIAIGEGKLPFAELLYQVAAVEGVERIRFTTSNPHDFTPALAQAFADLPQLANNFHLPVQAGSNKILDRMNRQYTREEYLEKAAMIRAVRPNIAFSTDIIVGFPGETEEDFEDTLNLVREMKYAFIYAFKYSPRRGTPATRFKDHVPDDVMEKRLHFLQGMQREETLRQNLAEIGQTRSTLIIYKNRKEEGTWYGRTYEGRLVKVFSNDMLLGKTLNVNVTGANLTALEGYVV